MMPRDREWGRQPRFQGRLEALLTQPPPRNTKIPASWPTEVRCPKCGHTAPLTTGYILLGRPLAYEADLHQVIGCKACTFAFAPAPSYFHTAPTQPGQPADPSAGGAPDGRPRRN